MNHVTAIYFFGSITPKVNLEKFSDLEVIGDFKDEIDLDELEKIENGIAQVAYVFHESPRFEAETAVIAASKITFDHDRTESRSFSKNEILEKGGREEWFDRDDQDISVVDTTYITCPRTPEHERRIQVLADESFAHPKPSKPKSSR